MQSETTKITKTEPFFDVDIKLGSPTVFQCFWVHVREFIYQSNQRVLIEDLNRLHLFSEVDIELFDEVTFIYPKYQINPKRKRLYLAVFSGAILCVATVITPLEIKNSSKKLKSPLLGIIKDESVQYVLKDDNSLSGISKGSSNESLNQATGDVALKAEIETVLISTTPAKKDTRANQDTPAKQDIGAIGVSRAKFVNTNDSDGENVETPEELQSLFGDIPDEDIDDINARVDFEQEPIVLKPWSLKGGNTPVRASSQTDNNSVGNTSANQIVESLSPTTPSPELLQQENQSFSNNNLGSTGGVQSQPSENITAFSEIDSSPDIDIDLVDSLFGIDESELLSTANPSSAIGNESNSVGELENSTGNLVFSANGSNPNNNTTTFIDTSSIFGGEDDDSGETSNDSTNNLSEQTSDTVEFDNVTTNELNASTGFEIAWFEGFDGPGLDLNRFVTPGTSLVVDSDSLKFTLDATHVGLEQEGVQLYQSIALDDGIKKLETQLTVIDLSMEEAGIQSAESVLVIEIPLEREESITGETSLYFARMTLRTDLENKAHFVTLGAYEETLDLDNGSNSLGETTFTLGISDSSLLNELTELKFSLDTGSPNRIELVVNENRLSIPVELNIPDSEPIMTIDLSAHGAFGEYSRIDASIENILVDGSQLFNISDRLIIKDSTPTLGHSLSVQDSAVRLSASGGSVDTSRVLLATRSNLSETSLIREVETTSLIATVSFEEHSLNGNRSESRDNSDSESIISILHTLFEIDGQGSNLNIVAVIKISPSNNTNDNGLINIDATAQLVSIDLPNVNNVEWFSILENAQVVAEKQLGENMTITPSTQIGLTLVNDTVTFVWGGSTVELSHGYNTQWYPSLNSESAVIIESGLGESLTLGLDNVGVTRR